MFRLTLEAEQLGTQRHRPEAQFGVFQLGGQLVQGQQITAQCRALAREPAHFQLGTLVGRQRPATPARWEFGQPCPAQVQAAGRRRELTRPRLHPCQASHHLDVGAATALRRQGQQHPAQQRFRSGEVAELLPQLRQNSGGRHLRRGQTARVRVPGTAAQRLHQVQRWLNLAAAKQGQTVQALGTPPEFASGQVGLQRRQHPQRLAEPSGDQQPLCVGHLARRIAQRRRPAQRQLGVGGLPGGQPRQAQPAPVRFVLRRRAAEQRQRPERVLGSQGRADRREVGTLGSRTGAVQNWKEKKGIVGQGRVRS